MDENILSAISTVGFPIVVSCYLLVKFQATLDRFSNKVDETVELKQEIQLKLKKQDDDSWKIVGAYASGEDSSEKKEK